MPPALPVLVTLSSCLALARYLTQGIALLTGVIANGLHLHQERVHLQSLSIVTVCVCKVIVGLGPVAAEMCKQPESFHTGMNSLTLLGIGGLFPVPINHALLVLGEA